MFWVMLFAVIAGNFVPALVGVRRTNMKAIFTGISAAIILATCAALLTTLLIVVF